MTPLKCFGSNDISAHKNSFRALVLYSESTKRLKSQWFSSEKTFCIFCIVPLAIKDFDLSQTDNLSVL